MARPSAGHAALWGSAYGPPAAVARVSPWQCFHFRELLQVQGSAALVAWIAKDVSADIDGKALLLHAAATARRAALLQATSVLVVDPFDEETAAMWRERCGFRPSAEPAERKRLWLPLQVVS
jgi:hypothetical protein